MPLLLMKRRKKTIRQEEFDGALARREMAASRTSDNAAVMSGLIEDLE